MPPSASSAYEALRMKNIARNNEMLITLGLSSGKDSSICTLLPTSTSEKQPTKPRRKRKIVIDETSTDVSDTQQELPRRSSKRLQKLQDGLSTSPSRFFDQLPGGKSCPASSTRISTSERKYGALLNNESSLFAFPNYISDILNEGDFDCSAVTLRWDATKVHQHLTLSKSRCTVVTTGCAGYGAVLSSKNTCAAVSGKSRVTSTPTTRKNKNTQRTSSNITSCGDRGITRWRVEVMCVGVGGFAVGVANKNTAYPFKSLGNRTDCYVLHCSGHLLHNRTRTALVSGKREEEQQDDGSVGLFGKGDVLEVEVEEGGRLGFRVNEGVVMDSKVKLTPGEYVLCCQPYMGGGARLLG